MIKITSTENGIVRGIPAADPRIIAFKGVPFAAPATGENRWRAPQPAKDWEGVRDCLEFGPIAMQTTPGLDPNSLYSREWHVDPAIPMGEDCLQVNIWTPARDKTQRLPVFLWYYGGGLQVGYPAEMEFDGERIARRGVVVVTANYRVNVFGFFAHPEITREAPEAPANFGNLDQQYALKWIRRNIASFGGDPDCITIGGQSAGGGSVLTQLNCPANAPYIKGAIIDSGIIANNYSARFGRRELADAEAQGERFLSFLGVKSIAEARKLPAEFIRDKNDQFKGFWGTVVDGVYQTDTHMNNIRRGAYIDVPLLWGHTDDEFKAAPKSETTAELREEAKALFGEKAERFMELAAVDGARISSIEYSIRAAQRYMENNRFRSPHYYYTFGPEIPGPDHPGSFHSSDLWFWFETLAKCRRPFRGKQYDLSRQMCNYWANFIKTGDPNGCDDDGTPMENWKPFTEREPNRMTLRDAPKAEVSRPTELMQFLVDAWTNDPTREG